jgi:MATE family multidrug resistance protein
MSEGVHRALLRLAVPACLSRFAMLGLTLITSLFVGRTSVVELAYLGISASVQNSMLSPSYGLLAGFTPAVAGAHAAGQHRECRRLLTMGVALGFAVGCGLGLILLQGAALLRLLSQPEGIIEAGARCLSAFAWGMPAMTAVYAGMIMLEAMGRPRIPLMVMGLGNVVNVACLFWLVDGASGLAVAGAEAAAVATSLARWAMAAAILVGAVHAASRQGADATPPAAKGPTFGRLLKLGLPIALAACFETMGFTLLASFAGMLGAEALAGFQVAQNLYRLPFVVVAAIGIASGVQCAAAVGRGEAWKIRAFGIGGMQIGAGILVLVAGGLALFPVQAASFFTSDHLFAESIRGAVLITAVLIVFDGVQGHMNNLLRGLNDTAIPSITQFIAFWGVATPLGYLLAFKAGWGLNGVLAGLTVGLAVAASLLLLRFFSHPMVRRAG